MAKKSNQPSNVLDEIDSDASTAVTEAPTSTPANLIPSRLPAVGMRVLYVLPDGAFAGDMRPADVVKVFAGNRVGITVTHAEGDVPFIDPISGVCTHRYYDGRSLFAPEPSGIPYDADRAPGTWHHVDFV